MNRRRFNQQQLPAQQVTVQEIEDAIENETGEQATPEQVQQIKESLLKEGVEVVRRKINQQQLPAQQRRQQQMQTPAQQRAQSQQIADQIADQLQTVTQQQVQDAIEVETGEEATPQQVQQVTESLKRMGFIVESRRRRFNQQQTPAQQRAQQQMQTPAQQRAQQQMQTITQQEIADAIEVETGEEATPEQVQQIAESLKRDGKKVILESRSAVRKEPFGGSLKIKKIKLFAD